MRSVAAMTYSLRRSLFPVHAGLAARRLDDLVGETEDLRIDLLACTKDPGAGSFWDMVTIAALARYLAPAACFEIGTGRGRGTIQLAGNSPADATVYTMDISDQPEVGSVFRDRPEAAKIRRLHSNSRTFSFEPWHDTIGLVLVDGDHGYEGVRHDTQVAFRLVAPGGGILWHDVGPNWPGVIKALRERPERDSIYRVYGTNFAYYRRPPAPTSNTRA